MSEAAPSILKFTPEKLAEMRKKGGESLFYFSAGIVGNDRLDEELHWDLCQCLEGKTPYKPWTRCLVCAFRGSLKTTVAGHYILREVLYNENFSVMLMEQKFENAVDHHRKIQDAVLVGPNAALIQEMFRDRWPTRGFSTWTRERTTLKTSDPNAEAAIYCVGIETKLEGKHPDMIVGDDLEGADADKSDVSNEEAQRFVDERSPPLLKDPGKSKLLILGTPHGANPTVWWIREKEAGGSVDPKHRKLWQIWWKPIRKDDGSPQWPSRFGERFIRELDMLAKTSKKSKRMVETQYYLRRWTGGTESFDLERILSNCYTMEHNRLIRYPAPLVTIGTPENNFQMGVTQDHRHVDLRWCNRFMHIDPAHRDPEDRIGSGKERPSDWGVIITAVAADWNVFAVHEWIEQATFDEALARIFRLYQIYRPLKVSYEGIGAQNWLAKTIKILERSRYRELMSIPTVWNEQRQRLPRLSARMEEVHKKGAEKEKWIVEQLEALHGMGMLHLSEVHTPKLLAEHGRVADTLESIDGLDALAQGPTVWSAPISEAQRKQVRIQDVLRKVKEKFSPSLYERPWD